MRFFDRPFLRIKITPCFQRVSMRVCNVGGGKGKENTSGTNQIAVTHNIVASVRLVLRVMASFSDSHIIASALRRAT